MPRKPALPILTRAESEVMSALWSGGPQTVHQLLERMKTDAAYTTVLTLVRILEQKGYVTHSAGDGRAHLYRPCVDERAAKRRHLRDLMDRLFAGRADGLLAGLLDDESLGHDELEALRRQIDARLKKPQDGGER